MSSSVQLCNEALSILGAARITSLSDNTREARLCNTFFDNAVKQVLMQGPWAFAVRRAELNQEVTTPEFEYAYQYQLPTNPLCLRVLKTNEEVPGEHLYRIEGDKLLTDESTMEVQYIAYITDTGLFSPMFEQALVARLAMLMCYAITANASMTAELKKSYMEAVANGLAMDGQQGSADYTWSTDLIDVR